MEEYMWTIWLVIFAISLIVEVSVSGLVSVWVAFGALITLALSFIPGFVYYYEIITFVGISILAIILTRPLCKRILKGKDGEKTNLNLLIGTKVKLIKRIEPLSKGEAKLNGVYWDCEAEDESTIEKGSVVEVLYIKGNKLIVKEVKDNE